MIGLSHAQMLMLRDLADGDPTDYADFADRAGSALGWLNRDRVMKSLERKGLIDGDRKLTDAGRAVLVPAVAAAQSALIRSEFGSDRVMVNELAGLLAELIDIEGPCPGNAEWATKVRAALRKVGWEK